ncbi:Aspartate kinase [Croceitalea dokdonensis DOKDO 023]|uniref:Aspartokinase n=1 Tax=Croceitalea dokdonensis DOKDO 023 TaxID=1300341 RepID=A0A0P7AW70_9FLAO|nr:aspartate kinase [Croceitalea dokdonensis]KPM32275.1 Aspartate kinase [Croceitalea dokdonensis DOKDO 023]
MRIFKFGGASVKDAAGVKNVVQVLKEVGHKDTLLVISAMGKTTNAMEQVVDAYFKQKNGLEEAIQIVVDNHKAIMDELFEVKNHAVHGQVNSLIEEFRGFLMWNKSPKYAFVYDQVVGYGELLSTTIVSAYLNEVGLTNHWLDVRELIKTDNSYRDAQVNWERTEEEVKQRVNTGELNITQGFLGSDDNNFTTTLGREGSDYTAAILAYCLKADSVTIWKDVPGVLNADPRHFQETQLLHEISYREAIELAFYGASVIHPKTLQPLQGKGIPLHVKSFLNPKANGTTVGKGTKITPEVPCFIVKKNQVLLKLSSLDFSFIVEENMSEIFKLFHEHRLKVDLIQNSAISFSVCIDNKFGGLHDLLPILEKRFKVTCHTDVALYTIRHFDEHSVEKILNGYTVLVEQRGKETVQLVVN